MDVSIGRFLPKYVRTVPKIVPKIAKPMMAQINHHMFEPVYLIYVLGFSIKF